MPHGNSCGALNMNATDLVCIFKESNCYWPSFDM